MPLPPGPVSITRPFDRVTFSRLDFNALKAGVSPAEVAEMWSLPIQALKPRNLTPQQMLQGLLKAGAKVEVCALYLPNSGHHATDLVAGVTTAKPADVAAYLLSPGVRTLAF